MKKQNDEITLKDVLDIFIPKLWFIVLIAVICSLALGTLSFMKDDVYTSTCTFSMGKQSLNENESYTGVNESEIAAMRNMIESTAYILKSVDFCTKVHEQLNYQYDEFQDVKIPELQKMMSVSLLGEATFFAIDVKSGNPQLSQAVAGIVNDELSVAFGERFSYAVKIDKLDYPELPTAPDSKNVVRNAVIGFVAGALIAVLIVFILNRFDVIIRSKEKIEENFDIPVLGVIPRLEIDN